MKDTTGDAILSVAVVASTLHVSRQRVHQLIQEGKLTAHQWDGRHWCVRASDLESYIGAEELERSQAVRTEWRELRRAILKLGGIGPSPDWPRDWYPGDIYRTHGLPPDLIAAELHPWSKLWAQGDDAAMFSYIRGVYEQHQNTLRLDKQLERW